MVPKWKLPVLQIFDCEYRSVGQDTSHCLCSSPLDMPKGSPLRLSLSHLTRKPSSSTRRLIHSSRPCSSAVTLPVCNALEPGFANGASRTAANAHTKNTQEILKERLFGKLEGEFASRKPSHERVWGIYMDLLHTVGARHIPLETHGRVLRCCTPSTEELRVSTALRLRARRDASGPKLLEDRLDTVIRNIEAAGHTPVLEDYHVILAHFAAVGQHEGAVQVYKELVERKFEPQPKTYGLILQAVAHRLTLPCAPSQKPRYVRQATAVCRDILTEMWGRGVSVSSANLDLAMRILKESVDEEAFAHFMRVGYAIDLDYPDRSPVQVLERQAALAADADGVTVRGVSEPQPFSTAALNTTIEILGRFGNISKLVQTFEVLTQPLPLQANQHFSHAFDEEDDDFGIANPASTPAYRAPHAAPNTTTYNLLIKHISRAGHASLARHYLQEAFRRDRVADRANRSNMWCLSEGVPAPHFAINKGTILPVFGLANREKDIVLMRWVSWVARQTLRRKETDIAYYSGIAKQLAAGQPAPEKCAAYPIVGPSPQEPPTSAPSAAASKATTSEDEVAAVFAVDLDAPLVPPPTPTKVLDLSFHIQLLQRDRDQLASFCQDIDDIIARTAQRVKERLGRRVWAGKSVFFLHNGQRELISRPTWSEIVHFKTAEPSEEQEQHKGRRQYRKADIGSASAAGQHQISTSAAVDRA